MKRLILSAVSVMALLLLMAACGHTHEFGEWTTASEATCVAVGVRERICECGEKETMEIPAVGHDYADASCLSAKTCRTCGAVEGEALGHAWSDATCHTPKTCQVCGTTEGEPLAHDWSDATCALPAACRQCGETQGEALGHTWVEATCVTPKTCSVCSATEGAAIGHVLKTATCTKPMTCRVCNETVGEAKGHSWIKATCTEPKTCEVCEKTSGKALGHNYKDATCTEAKACSRCKNTVGEALGHSWVEATCDAPKTCSTCRKTQGEALAHMWVEATCAAPKTCSACLITDGDALPHSWVEADCETPKTCSVCKTTEGEAIGHVVGDDTCSDLICETCFAIVKEQTHDFVTKSEILPTLLEKGSRESECSKCHETRVTVLDVIDPADLDIPVIYITDIVEGAIPLADLKKPDGAITVRYQYVSNDDSIESFDSFCEIKIQGSSSSAYPKKNFTVKFFKDELLESKLKVDLGWGKENKYCMKANYIDFSQSRNVVGGKLFAQIVETRNSIHAGLSLAPNYGLVDGYPVLVYLNGTFHGIYTMNIPKDDWMFGMEGEDGSKEALLMADQWTDSVNLRKEIGSSYSSSGWVVEYCSTEDDAWVRESFNKLIALLNCGDGQRIRSELAAHLDVEAAIDNMLFTYFINGADNLGKNILWATYDGEIWIPSMYDMDSTFGISWKGTPLTVSNADAVPVYPSITEGGLSIPGLQLYSVLIECYPNEVEARWIELRQSVLSMDNVKKTFNSFFDRIPEVAYTSDADKWTKVPYPDVNRTNIFSSTEEQLERLDAFFYHFNSKT